MHSASALWGRVRALEEAGVIERYGAVVNSAQTTVVLRTVKRNQSVTR